MFTRVKPSSSWKTVTWRHRQMKARAKVEQTKAAYQLMTGTTVFEDKTKSRLTFKPPARRSKLPRRFTKAESSYRRKERWRGSWSTMLRSRWTGAEPARNRQRHLQALTA